MTVAVQGYEKAFQMGRAAFHNGIKCAPCNDRDFMDWTCPRTGKPFFEKTKEEHKRTIQLLDAWLGGWTMENIKAPVGRS